MAPIAPASASHIGRQDLPAECDHCAVVGSVDAQQHLGEGGLARSRLPYQPDRFADLNFKVDVAAGR